VLFGQDLVWSLFVLLCLCRLWTFHFLGFSEALCEVHGSIYDFSMYPGVVTTPEDEPWLFTILAGSEGHATIGCEKRVRYSNLTSGCSVLIVRVCLRRTQIHTVPSENLVGGINID